MSTSTQTLTRPTVRQLVEGLGAFVVLAAGVVGIPVVLATVIGWPLPHHLPGGVQVAGALRTPIPDSFWPHLFASLAWLAWAYFALSVVATLVAHLRGASGNRRHRLGSHRATSALVSAVITAVVVLGQLRAAPAGRAERRRVPRRDQLRRESGRRRASRAAHGRHRASGRCTTRSGDAHRGAR